MSSIRLQWMFPPGGLLGRGWQEGEEQLQNWQWCNTQSSQQPLSGLQPPCWKQESSRDDDSYCLERDSELCWRDLSNTPYVIIPLATPGSLETIINNTYQNCFHSLCPGGLPPSSHTTPTPFFPMTNESPASLCFLHDHTTGWAFQTYQCPLNSRVVLGTCLGLLGLRSCTLLGPSLALRFPDWFHRLWWTRLSVAPPVLPPPLP